MELWRRLRITEIVYLSPVFLYFVFCTEYPIGTYASKCFSFLSGIDFSNIIDLGRVIEHYVVLDPFKYIIPGIIVFVFIYTK
jgi:hypothetical protein